MISISAGSRVPNVIGCTWYLAPSVHRERRRHAGGQVVALKFRLQHRAVSSGNYFFARVYSPPGLKRQRYTHVPNGGRGAIEDMGGCESCSCRLLVIRERVVSIAAWKRCSIERQEGSLLLYTNHTLVCRNEVAHRIVHAVVTATANAGATSTGAVD